MKAEHQTEAANNDYWQKYKISKISIDGFKSLQQIDDFKLKNLNVLVGANGTGKSNFIDFFEMLRQITNAQNLQHYVAVKGGADELLFHGVKQTSSIGAQLHFSSTSEKIEYAFRLTLDEKNRFIFIAENCFSSDVTTEEGGGWGWAELEHKYKESKITDAPDMAAKITRKILEHCTVYQFHDTSATSQLKTEADIDDKIFLRGDGGNLAAVLYELKENNTRAYNEIKSCIRQVLPIFDGFELTPLHRRVMLHWRQKKNQTKSFGPNLTSDGTLRLMALITLLCMPKERIPGLVLLDEPELGLHPYAIAIITSLIKRLSINKQIIVATQSPQLLNDLTIDDIIITEISKDGATSFKRPKAEEYKTWLENSQLGDMWQANAFGGNP